MRNVFGKLVWLVVRCVVLLAAGYAARMWVESRRTASAPIVELHPAPALVAPEPEAAPEPKASSGLSRAPSVADEVITVHVDDLKPEEREIINLDFAALERQLQTLGSYFDAGWVESESMDTQQIRQNLQNEESRLSDLRADLREASEADADTQADELSVVDQHPADVGTEMAQKEVDLSLLEQIEAELSDVERAMRKLDDGTYGKCEVCQNDIGAERLEVAPAARYCIEHAS